MLLDRRFEVEATTALRDHYEDAGRLISMSSRLHCQSYGARHLASNGVGVSVC